MSAAQAICVKDFEDIHGVRISPYPLIFKDVHLFKDYKEKLTIQNITNTNITIRIVSPKSDSYKLKSIPRGLGLSPGLSIIRHVSLEYTESTEPYITLPIYVNDHRVDYQILIKPSVPKIKFEPDKLDFGTVDAGFSSAVRKLTIRNDGTKPAYFYIDFGKSNENLVAEPNKGGLKPGSAIEISIRIVCFKEKTIDSHIFIKAVVRFAIPVHAKIIFPKLEAIHANTTDFFTFIDFPPTYVGVKTVKHIMIRNYSGNVCMFQTLGEYYSKVLTMEEFDVAHLDSKFFKISPQNGAFASDETKIFTLTFEPLPPPPKEKHRPYYFCTFLINRFIFKSIGNQGIKTAFTFILKLLLMLPLGDIPSQFEAVNAYQSLKMPSESPSLGHVVDTLQPVTNVGDSILPIVKQLQRNFVRIYMLGLAEIPSVTIVPDEINIKDVQLLRKQTRVLTLINNSSRLPIIFRYQKVPFIDLEKNSVFLKPSQKLEVSVFITAHKLGMVTTKINFNLVFKDYPETDEGYKIIGSTSVSVVFMPSAGTKPTKPQLLNQSLTPNYIKEVGKNCSNLRFNTQIKKCKAITVDPIEVIDKHCTDLVAFPNDTRRSLRPWRSDVPCRSIFSRQPRYIQPLDLNYEMRADDQEFKEEVARYYMNFMRAEADKIRKHYIEKIPPICDYSVTDRSKLLCKDMKCIEARVVTRPLKFKEHFIALGALEMSKIQAEPAIIQTGPISSHEEYNFNLKILNGNNFPVKVIINFDKPNVYVVGGENRIKIKGLASKLVKLCYFSSWPGFYTATINLIVNESYVLPVEILANVVIRCLKLNIDKLIFEAEEMKKYVDITNELNTPLPFFWTTLSSNCTVIPTYGEVKPGRKITALVKYGCHKEGSVKSILEFHSGENTMLQIEVISKTKPKKLILITESVHFDNVPLNRLVHRFIIFKNAESHALSFEVIRTEILEEVKVIPKRGVVPGDSTFMLIVSATFRTCCKFNSLIKVNIVQAGILEIPLIGKVVYPHIQITTKDINFTKIPASTTTTETLSLFNRSAVRVSVRFDMFDFQEFKISDSPNFWDEQIENIIIEPKKTAELYIHFIPNGATSLTFLLPIVINDLLGPPVYQDVITSRVDFYLIYALPDSLPTSIPRYIPTIKVKAFATDPLIVFSKTRLVFNVMPWKKDQSYILKINNPQKVQVYFSIGIENLTKSFNMAYSSGYKVIKSKRAISCLLPAKEETSLIISFTPKHFDALKILLPVMIRGERNTLECHNVLILEGYAIKPAINFERDRTSSTTQRLLQSTVTEPAKVVYYSRPLPLNVTATSTKKFNFTHHLNNCEIKTYTDLDFVEILVNYSSLVRLSSIEYSIKVTFKCSPYENVKYTNVVKVYCSCGGEWMRTIIGCAENSFLTSYAFSETFLPQRLAICDSTSQDTMLKHSLSDDVTNPSFISQGVASYQETRIEYHTLEFFSSFPFFPSQGSALAVFLTKAIKISENWISSQAFYQKCFYAIPSGFVYITFEAPVARRSVLPNKQDLCIMPFAKLLINLAGKQMIAYLNLKPAPVHPIDRIRYVLSVYGRALQFLNELGAYFIYLHPEHLLDYTNFVLYKETLFEYEENPSTITAMVKTIEQHFRLSKQSWLDLILQTYKVLCVNRLKTDLEKDVRENILIPKFANPLLYFMKSLNDVHDYASVFSVPEMLVMRWLKYHFHRSNNLFWPEYKFSDREINIFGDGFEDGLVLAGITLTYCPYLIPYFSDLYVEPSSQEEVIHNYTTLLKYWEKLNMSFKISVKDIMKVHSIQLLMLCVYLYDILPFFYPTEKIEFKCGLSQTTTKVVQIANPNNFPIAYSPIMVPFDLAEFTVNKPLYVIDPKKSCSITIKYNPKFAKDTEATLLLSGECARYRYSKNKVITLIGIPDLTYVSTTVKFPMRLYQHIIVQFIIKSPYKTSATYELQVSYEQIQTADELKLVIYSHQRHRLAGGVFTPLQEYFHFDSNGVCRMKAMVDTLRLMDVHAYLFFRNQAIGDFTIMVSILVEDTNEEQTLEVKFPKNYDPERTKLYVPVPCRNHLYWRTVKQIILQLTSGDEYKFWKNIIDTNTGMQFVSRLLMDHQMIPTMKSSHRHLTGCEEVVYNVDCLSKDVALPTTIKIDNECSPGHVKVPLTLVQVPPSDFSIILNAQVGISRRLYFVKFIFDND